MTKPLHQVFGIWTTGVEFEPQHEAKSTEKKSETSGPTDESETPKEPMSKEVTEAPASLEPVIEHVETKEAPTNSALPGSQKQVSIAAGITRQALDFNRYISPGSHEQSHHFKTADRVLGVHGMVMPLRQRQIFGEKLLDGPRIVNA